MDYSKMRWIGAIVPGMIAWTFETLRHLYFERAMGGAVGNVATFALVTLVTYLILDRVFQAMESVGERLSREQNRSALLKERDRIAREMHDGLSQALFFLNTKLSSIEKDLAKNEIESARRQLAEAQLATQEVYTRVRQTIYDLRASAGDDWRLEPALAQYVADFQDETGIAVELELDVESECTGVEEAFHLFRIVQEALFNVRRHAGGSKVRVALRLEAGGRCELEIADDGRGFDIETALGMSGGHYGLVMMQERSRLIGAEFDVESAPGRGTRIRVFRPPAADPGRQAAAGLASGSSRV